LGMSSTEPSCFAKRLRSGWPSVTREVRVADVPHTALRIYGAALFSSPFYLGFLSFSHLAFAAVRAILLRSIAVSFCSRAFAPLRPIAESAEAD